MSDAVSKSEAMFMCWAPDEDIWTSWAKPVLFNGQALAGASSVSLGYLDAMRGLEELCHLEHTAIIVDLPGAESVKAGLALLEQGYRPVPLYNGCEGSFPVVPVEAIAEAVAMATEVLKSHPPAINAPPAFLLDSQRMSGSPNPGRFDNRWMVFPQDFPSGNLLLSLGYQQVVVISASDGTVQEDLAHVLLRWKEAGMSIKVFSLSWHSIKELVIVKPSLYKVFFYRALSKIGLHPNSAGGFGDVIPVPAESSYGGYG